VCLVNVIKRYCPGDTDLIAVHLFNHLVIELGTGNASQGMNLNASQ